MINRFEHFSLAISEINRYWHKIASEGLEKYGLKGPHATYLSAMAKHENGITVPLFCEICGKDKADVSRMMNIPMKKGLGLYRKLIRHPAIRVAVAFLLKNA